MEPSWSSPRTWGCFRQMRHKLRRLSLPHARGGVSAAYRLATRLQRSSPRTWGCFSGHFSLISGRAVFPTHVGVFPKKAPCRGRGIRLPHARGGVSYAAAISGSNALSSPRTWGCFYFPDAKGNKVKSLPHARGGVSIYGKAHSASQPSSPRTWGCFSSIRARRVASSVFPTHVGVFPSRRACGHSGNSLPHARGGVSSSRSMMIYAPGSSPRTQGRRSIWQRRGAWHRNMNVLYRAELRENERRKI